MNQAPRYFLLVMGASNATPQKFWTKEDAINYLVDNFHAAKNSQFLEVTSDSGQLVYSRDEALSLVKSHRGLKTTLPILLLIFLGSLFAPAPLDKILLIGYAIVFIPFWFTTGRGVIAFNRSLLRRLRRK